MAKKVNPYKFCKRTSIDGKPLKKGQVLVPIWLQDGYQIPSALKDTTTTWHFGEFEFHIGFMPQPKENFEAYMGEFYTEINMYLAERRTGRCIIDRKPNGEPILCPKSRRCTGCPEKYDHERYNPLKDRWQIISLNSFFEDESYDYPDENAVNPEDHVIAQEEESDEDLRARTFAHLEEKNARYAQIAKLEVEGKGIEEICIAIKLKSSRGREVINEANDALCDYIKMPHMKTKHHK